MSLNEVQYDTGIPNHIYPVGNNWVPPPPGYPLPRPHSLGAVTPTTSVAATSSGVSITQVSSLVGDVGKLGLSFFQEYNDTSIEKKKLKYEAQIATLQANLSHLTESERIAAQIEIQKIQADLEKIITETKSGTGLEMTKILALAGVASIGLIGAFAYLSRKAANV